MDKSTHNYQDEIKRIGEFPVRPPADDNEESFELGFSTLTEEEVNFLKFTNLVLRLVPRALRILFDKKIPPDQLCSRLNQYKYALAKLKNDKLITKQQWEDVMFPSTGNSQVKSTSFDLSLQFVLLQELTNIKITGEDPGDEEMSDDKSVSILNFYFKYVTMTSSSTMSLSEFTSAWEIVEQAVEYLAGKVSKEECETFKKTDLDPEYVNLLIHLINARKAIMESSRSVSSISERFLKICASIERLKRVDFPILQDEVSKLLKDVKHNASLLSTNFSSDNPTAQWEAMNKFVRTGTVGRIERIIRKNQVVIIAGRPGIGKATAARHVCSVLQREGYEIVQIQHPKYITNTSSKTIYLCENAFGANNVNLYLLEEWDDSADTIFKILYAENNARLVITMTKNILDTCSGVLKLRKRLHPFVCDLSENMYNVTTSEYKQIWSSYLKKESYEAIIGDTQPPSILPLLCHLYSQKKEHDIKIGTIFFKETYETIESFFTNLYKADEYLYFFLLLLVIKNNRVPKHYLTQNEQKDEIQAIFKACFSTSSSMPSFSGYITYGIEKLKGLFVNEIQEVYTAVHVQMFNFFVKFFVEKHTEVVITSGDIGLICDYMVLQSLDLGTPVCGEAVIEEQYEKLYYQRILTELRKGHSWQVFSSLQMSNTKFRQNLISYITKNADKTDIRKISNVDSVYIAAKYGYDNLLEYLLRNRPPSRTLSSSGKTPLWAASFSGNIESIRLLLKYKEDVNQETLSGETALYIACREGHSKILDVLIKHHGDVNQPQNDGVTPLFIACLKNDTNMAKTLLKHRANPHDIDYDGTSPLHVACFNDNIELVKSLLKEKSNVSHTTISHGIAPIHVSSFRGNKAMTDLLLKYNADINQKMKDGVTPLYIASDLGHSVLVNLFVKNNAILNDTTNFGMTPMYVASINNHQSIVDILRSSCMSSSLHDKIDDKGQEQLIGACQNGYVNIIEWLVNNDKDINQNFDDGITALHLSTYNGQKEVVQKLLMSNADVNKMSESGVTPIYMACHRGYIEIVQLLLDWKAEINLSADYGYTPLYIACENGHTTVAALLLRYGADVNQTKKGGLSPLYIASHNGHTHVVQMLLDQGAFVNHIVDKGDAPLHIASYNGHVPIVELLLCYHANINMPLPNGTTPIFIASVNGHSAVVSTLLNNGADVNQTRKKGSSPLFIACMEGHELVVQLLINGLSDVNQKKDGGYSPLYIAARQGHIRIVSLLLKHKADINITDSSGITPLYIACEQNKKNVVEYLLKHKANVNCCTRNGYTPIHISCENNFYEITKLLLENGADLTCKDANGFSPLHLASRNGYINIIRLLIKSGHCHVDVNIETSNGTTPLFVACEKNDKSTIVYLLKHGADINHKSAAGVAPLNIALNEKHIELATFLLQCGADINIQNNAGMTPLYLACQDGNFDVLELLLKHDADVNLPTEKGATPLYRACINGNENIVEMLLHKHADVNFCKRYDLSPLYVSCFNGHLRIAEILLQHNADVNVSDSDQMTPLHVVCEKNREDLVDVLLLHSPDISKKNNAGFTPLDIARRNGNNRIISKLERN